MYHDCSTIQNDLAWKVLNSLVDLQVTVLEYELPAFVDRVKRQKQKWQSRDCGFMKNDMHRSFANARSSPLTGNASQLDVFWLKYQL